MTKIIPKSKLEKELSSQTENAEEKTNITEAQSFTPKLIQIPFQIVYKMLEENNYVPGLGNLTKEQYNALKDIALCKTSDAGYSLYQCSECGAESYNYNKCKNRNCPVCQNLKSMLWVDNQSVNVIDAPYFHIVITLPHELNPILFNNQSLLYSLLHKCAANSVLEIAKDPNYLGGTPGIITVLHTWNQHLNYHVHDHLIISGAGLTKDNRIVYCKDDNFFAPVQVLSKIFRGKFMDELKDLYDNKSLVLLGDAEKYKNRYEWKELINQLYKINWVTFIKETFNGNGNAIEYLARYTNKIAIGNSRILEVDNEKVLFSIRGEDGTQSENYTLPIVEFVRRYLSHVLPSGFQKIRYYGFLANGCRKKKLEIIFAIQGKKQHEHRYKEPTESEVLRVQFDIDVHACPKCGKKGTMKEVQTVEGKLSYTYIPKGKKKGYWNPNIDPNRFRKTS